MSDYKNERAQKAVDQFRANQNPQNLAQVAAALISSPLLLAVQSEKEPAKNVSGQYVLSPEDKFDLLAVRSNKGDVFFPMFTSTEEGRKVYSDKNVFFLPMLFGQYMPILDAHKEKANGIVINPKGANVPLRYDLLKGIADSAAKRSQKTSLNMNSIKKGQKIHLRNPQGNIDDLEAALISGGFHEEGINRIFLKERVVDPEHPDQTHWFIVVDAAENNPDIFKRLAEMAKDVTHGKEMEFMFASQKLGQDIANSSRPVYEKAAFVI